MLEKIEYIVLTTLLLIISQISRLLTASIRTSFGSALGAFLRISGSKRRNITLENIRKAFPDKDPAWIDKVMKGSYRNLGITFVELMAMKYMDEGDIKKYIRYSNIELINEIYQRGKGLLLLSGHYGNWEMLAYSAGLFSGVPVLVIVKPLKNVLADRIVNSIRTKAGNMVVSMHNAARHIVKQLAGNGVVALLADQSATYDKDIFVDFFGIPAATFESPANLALRLDVPIIMGFAERMDDGTYQVDLKEIRHEDLFFDKEGIEELTRRHVKMLEDAIRKRPDLWSWQHRRWKHSPQKKADNEKATGNY